MSEKPKSTALAVIQAGAIAVAESDEVASSVPTLIQESVEDFFRLPKVSVPTSGGKFFTVKDIDGDRPSESIEGVIALVHRKQRAFYSSPYGEGDKGPPDCMSTDGVTGYGRRGLQGETWPAQHDCASCPWNEFGSKEAAGVGKGRGRACREVIRLFMFDDDSFVPLMISVSPSSLGAARDYTIALARKGLRIHRVKTRIGLKTEKVSGYDTSMMTFQATGKLSPDEARRFDVIHDGLERALSPHMAGFLEREEREASTPRDVEVEAADTPFNPTGMAGGDAALTDDDELTAAEVAEAFGGVVEDDSEVL